MFQSIQRIRHINRYREILRILGKYGFGEIVGRLGLSNSFNPLKRLRDKDQPESATTTLDAPTRLRMALEELGPTFIKFGQSLSTRPDFVPPDFLIELEKLQDEVPPVPWDLVKPVIETELSGKLSDFFNFVNPQSLAAASLAQVHVGELLDGTEVVLKVQRPNIRRKIEIDLEILQDVANLLQTITSLGKIYDLPDIVEDFAYNLNMELDYRYEGQHADLFRQNFRRDPTVYIPEIYWDYVTERLLVMEMIHGIKIDDVEALDAAGYNRPRIARNAARAIVKEILEDGVFHADPHPGNILIMEGEVLGLLDFGMIGWLDKRLRNHLARLYIVTVRQDIDGMVERLIQIGIADTDVDRRDLRHDLSRLLRKYYGRPLQDLSAGDFSDDVSPLVFRNRLQIPTDIWLLLKTLVIMEGVGRQLDPNFDIFETSQPIVKRLSRKLWSFEAFQTSMSRTASGWGEFLTTSPEVGLRLMRRLEDGKVKVQIEPVEYERLLARIDQVANRVVVSLLLSAMILGLALLIPSVGNQQGWFNAVLVFMFIVSAGLGLWVAISIIRGGSSS